MGTSSLKPTTTSRPAGPQDAPAIAKLGARVFSTTFGHSVTPDQLKTYLEESYSVDAVMKDITDPNKDMFVAVTEQGAVAGFVLVTRGSTEPCVDHLDSKVELQRLYIDIDLHGQGIGRLLGLEAERIAKDQGYRHMWLGVWEENYKAQKVYEKMGYKVVGDHDFDIGGDIQTDHIMLKEL